MNKERYKEFMLSNIPRAQLVSNGTEILCRCFDCPDSMDVTKAHFYISVPKTDEDLSEFYCQKCHSHGTVTHKKLLEWGIYDTSISTDLCIHNKHALQNPKNKNRQDIDVYKLNNGFITQDKLSEIKLNYLRKRIGYDLTYDDVLKDKILLNLTDIFKSNQITNYTRHESIIEQLDRYFVGFISMDNSFVNMRNIAKDQSKLSEKLRMRYVNYNIFGKSDNTKRFYTMPADINILEPIKIHIAEGAIDILSIYYNLRCGERNNIFTSIGGSGYQGICRFFINTMKFINLEIHIYADNDIEYYKIQRIAQVMAPFSHNMIYLHRNTYPGEKDFGVPLDRIRETIQRV